LWFETAYFGSFLLRQQFVSALPEPTRQQVLGHLRHAFLVVVPGVFESLASTAPEKEALREYIAGHYDDRFEMYEAPGTDGNRLFCDLIHDLFNGAEDSTVKFFDATLGNRLKLKMTLLLGSLAGGQFAEKHTRNRYLPRSKLSAFAGDATRAFGSVTDPHLGVSS
jgi:hypothetical protein